MLYFVPLPVQVEVRSPNGDTAHAGKLTLSPSVSGLCVPRILLTRLRTGYYLNEWKLEAMKAEKTSGAKIAPFYNAQADYARELEAERYETERGAMRLNSFGYIIALGLRIANEPDSMAYAGESGGATPNPQDAKQFETWADAMRYALDNYEFPAFDNPVPRGFERPKYPRVCHARIWAEVTEC